MSVSWNHPFNNHRGEKISVIDAHTAGEPLRIVTNDLALEGDTILERRRHMSENLDHVRRALMWEPRGHYDMYGCVVTPPVSDEADYGVIFMHNAGYSTMCGHGVIALVTALVECGVVVPGGSETQVNLDTPAGLVKATAHLDERGRVRRVSFLNVPSFVYSSDLEINVPGFGPLFVDIAFGGAFYAILPSARVSLSVSPDSRNDLVDVAEVIKAAVSESVSVQHPTEEDLSFLYGVILMDEPEDPGHHSRNICIFADGEVDRSPTGTGVSARLAVHHARGEIEVGQSIVVESILGAESVFEGRVSTTTKAGDYVAVVPEVSGRAFITGRSDFFLDPDDSLGSGFLIS